MNKRFRTKLYFVVFPQDTCIAIRCRLLDGVIHLSSRSLNEIQWARLAEISIADEMFESVLRVETLS